MVIARCWIVVAAVIYAVDLLQQTRVGLTNGAGRPFGDDFINYWSAPALALHGRITGVYDFFAFHAFEQHIVGPSLQFYHYSYPPVLVLLTMPLALIPYVPALGVWLLTSWYAFYRALKLAVPRQAILLALATPAVFVNAIGGQNGAWTAALLGGGLLLLERRPAIAGVLFGLLIYKPHLGIMLPIALLAGGRWRTVLAAGLTAMALVIASTALFGTDIWPAYSAHVAQLRVTILEVGTGVWHRMMSIFVFARRLGLGVMPSYIVQGFAAVIAAFFVARSWWRNDSPEVRNALVILGTCLATPYLQDYDLVVGAFVAVWLMTMKRHGHLDPRLLDGAAACVMLVPPFAAAFARLTGFCLAPIFIAFAFVVVVANSQSGAMKSA